MISMVSVGVTSVVHTMIFSHCLVFYSVETPQWGAADAEMKVPSGENLSLIHI